LDEANQYRTRDLYALRLRGKDAAGRLTGELEPTGELPSFCAEPYHQGMSGKIRLSGALWSADGERRPLARPDASSGAR
jgi:hypothetical protein